jgi:cytochrome c-type biogenesis protein CcmH/NrfG
MSRDSLAYAVSGTLFGLLVGWIIGTQYGVPPAAVPAAAPVSSAQAAPADQARPVDGKLIAELETRAKAEPANSEVRVLLGNEYFDAERYPQAIAWYEAALKIDPRNVNASTDLGVAYYSNNDVDRALRQFDHSLAVDPRHLKTLLNQGIVRAFGKQDLTGAAASWQQVVTLAPDSEEGRRAKQGLDGIRAAHPEVGAASGARP